MQARIAQQAWHFLDATGGPFSPFPPLPSRGMRRSCEEEKLRGALRSSEEREGGEECGGVETGAEEFRGARRSAEERVQKEVRGGVGRSADELRGVRRS